MAIVTLQDLPRSPINYSSEYFDKYLSLIGKITPLTTSGNASWTSPSSGINYPATTGGEAQLLSLLETALANYLLNATKWNSIQDEIALYLLKSGGAMTGTLAMARNLITQPLIKDYSEMVKVITTATGAMNLDLSEGNVFDVTLTGAFTPSFTNPAPSGDAHSFTILLRQGATAYAVTWPSSVKWSGDTIPTISDTNKTVLLSFVTLNAGARWYGTAVTKFTT